MPKSQDTSIMAQVALHTPILRYDGFISSLTGIDLAGSPTTPLHASFLRIDAGGKESIERVYAYLPVAIRRALPERAGDDQN